MTNDVFTLDFYKSDQILWHYEDKSANNVWAQTEITMHADGATLFGFNHLLVQSIIQENTTISNLACTSKDPIVNWPKLFITWMQQENSIIEFHDALSIIYPPIYELNEAEFRAWRAMLQAYGCTNIMPYSKSNNRKEFWTNLKMLYEQGYLQADLEYSDSSEDHVITNNEDIFWNSFRSALTYNKHETIAGIFKYNYWQWPIAGPLAGYIVACPLPHFGTPAHFSSAAITSLYNEELHRLEPKVSTHTEPQSKWIMALPKTQDKKL
ncbi:15475_t:CDS:2 [Cetraspora pellucida]|uniref:15475_t:CDS:1 n=1 Tax=Cetraspora pellucida TaxID=1433469 RepID=A0ACA9N4F8_9GLOM|nr:15475_t:CDS:2 [Cetraspora pellucida]